ncbi:E3 ubiquitin-protein ligase RNF19B-like [Herrania umbratica]|uniref:RBR-type E3 ubiquitin transferase n=1 Tax=Herrania umbratica TaxID=108875 RepID=A0A6J1ANG1_9ROSI|nr:E3 ubiquitin-protein ligase RNF19B-like [Herrania umbratica]
MGDQACIERNKTRSDKLAKEAEQRQHELLNVYTNNCLLVQGTLLAADPPLIAMNAGVLLLLQAAEGLLLPYTYVQKSLVLLKYSVNGRVRDPFVKAECVQGDILLLMKTDSRRKKTTGASSSASPGACYDARLADETPKFPRSKRSCSSNVNRKRKLHEIRSSESGPMKKQKGKEKEIDESYPKAASGSSKGLRLCKICMEEKPTSMMLRRKRCDHSSCYDCTRQHIATKMKENIIMIQCPVWNCGTLITPKQCKSILPGEVISRWKDALHCSRTPPVLEFDCPSEDCPARLTDNGKAIDVIELQCPNCLEKICPECKGFSHGDLDCDEYKELVNHEIEEEDYYYLALLKISKKENWKRCPNCNNFAGKTTEGSNKVECGCTYKFCYDCESEWSRGHSCFDPSRLVGQQQQQS